MEKEQVEEIEGEKEIEGGKEKDKNKRKSKNKVKSQQKETENQKEKEETKAPEQIPEEFSKIVSDFTEDICTTFPEYKPIIAKWWSNNENREQRVFAHCLRVFPERFFDILYQNDTMFSESSDLNTEFLPGVVFKYLWSCDITAKTRETIWKYLQLLLFSVINSVKSSNDFGDSAKLFEAINETELKTKLEETLKHMQTMFDSDGNVFDGEHSADASGETEEGPNIDMGKMPTAENIQEHIQNMMNGSLGKLAMELAEEAAEDLNLDIGDATSADDVFKKMFKNPGKLMNIVKNLGTKLDEKIKSGEIKESELISEGMEMLNKMKSMPGMSGMHDMLNKMGIPLPKGGKVNMNAMDAQMQKNLKMAQMKERMRKKNQESKESVKPASNASSSHASSSQSALSDEQLFAVFNKGAKAEKTPRPPKNKK